MPRAGSSTAIPTMSPRSPISGPSPAIPAAVTRTGRWLPPAARIELLRDGLHRACAAAPGICGPAAGRPARRLQRRGTAGGGEAGGKAQAGSGGTLCKTCAAVGTGRLLRPAGLGYGRGQSRFAGAVGRATGRERVGRDLVNQVGG